MHIRKILGGQLERAADDLSAGLCTVGIAPLLNVQPYNSLFQQPWWLDAVAPGSWEVVEVRQDDAVRARLPYFVERRFGLTMLTMPPLTQTLGPWLESSSAKYPNQLAQQKDLMTALIDQLPPFAYFAQNFHFSITNWLPFFWRGFTQTTRYTYVIEDLTDLDHVWNNMVKETRNAIRKAQKHLTVRCDLGINHFLDVNAQTFHRKGLKLPYSRDLVNHLDAACDSHSARRIFFAEDAQHNVHAAVYLVWDSDAAYYLMGGVNPAFMESQASSLLLWEAIKYAATVTRTFNFEGSMVESVEQFFRGFGAVQKPYSRIKKTNALPLKVYEGLRIFK